MRPMPSLVAWLAVAEARDPSAQMAPRDAVAAVGLLLAHEPQVRRLVHRLLGWTRSAHDVDDVVQEVLLAAWRHRESFRGEARIATWLCSIAVRKAKNHVRWAAVRRRWLA